MFPGEDVLCFGDFPCFFLFGCKETLCDTLPVAAISIPQHRLRCFVLQARQPKSGGIQVSNELCLGHAARHRLRIHLQSDGCVNDPAVCDIMVKQDIVVKQARSAYHIRHSFILEQSVLPTLQHSLSAAVQSGGQRCRPVKLEDMHALKIEQRKDCAWDLFYCQH